MTVTYTLDVSTVGFWGFAKLLYRWRGSLWKSVYKDLLVWLFLYMILSCVYRFMLDEDQRVMFEDFVAFAYKYTDFIPLTFMLGFFVSVVVTRWWDMFLNIGWVDNPSLHISTFIEGTDDKGRMIRRNIVRYLVLVQALIFRDISVTIRRRFPTLETLQAAGFMSEVELKTLQSVDSPNAKYWVPIQWAFFLIRDARRTGRITSDQAVRALMDKLTEYRSGLGKLCCYDSVPIPLVYTQVVFLTVRCYFVICLMGRQYVSTTRSLGVNSTVDYYIPIMTIIQFIFYVGWMKVAESLLNPFGEDDDDFEVNWLLDRNLQVGLTIVDDSIKKQPPLEKDVFWADLNPEPLYSAEAANTTINPLVGSATELILPKVSEDVVMVPRAMQEESAQTDGDVPNGVIMRGTSANSSVRGIKDVIRGKLTRLGSTISAQLQRKTSTPVGLPNNVEIHDSAKPDNLSGASSTISIVNELVRQAAIETLSSDDEAATHTEERGTMTGHGASVGAARRRIQSEDEAGIRTSDSELTAVIEEDETSQHADEVQKK